MNQQPVQISVVVPVRNAEGTVGLSIDALTERLRAREGRTEVVVVDDASDDATAQEAARAALDHPQVRVIPLHARSGPGYAARVGLLSASGALRVLLPPLQGTAEASATAIAPGTWEEALDRLAAGAAVVVGRRSGVMAVDAARAIRAVEGAYRHGTTFIEEVQRLARREGLPVHEVEADDPRGGLPGPPLSRAVRGVVDLIYKFRWPWAPVD